ncbi:MAG: FAD:protein FMN transferase [Candidatus Hydrogenedentes bacterium]|nr:FAD:protein FMN transferase [Candidatus Hydrogenedentota bacterium]
MTQDCFAKRGAVLAALLFFALAGCEPATPPEVLFQGPTMGAEYHVKAVARLSKEENAALHDAILAVLDRINTLMSNYQPETELSRFNRALANTPFPVSPETATVFACALQVSRESQGAFDITVGPLVNAWGFGPEMTAEPPAEAALEELLQRVGYEKLHLEGNQLTKDRDDVSCDLSALAPGFAADEMARLLESKGLNRYMIEVGGEVRALGLNKNDTPWRIGIEKPLPEIREIGRVVALDGNSLATSGDYRHFITVDGVRRSHTIDPSTGRPIEHQIASVTVIHKECMWADAYATALNVMGPERAKAFAETHQLAVFLILHDGKNGFEEWASPRFEPFIHVPVAG